MKIKLINYLIISSFGLFAMNCSDTGVPTKEELIGTWRWTYKTQLILLAFKYDDSLTINYINNKCKVTQSYHLLGNKIIMSKTSNDTLLVQIKGKRLIFDTLNKYQENVNLISETTFVKIE